ncbi:hypothetical protein EVAR_15663_1 [Eumeta japonica]|uniref:Uncharacterized protein n=1 Tax=Eumeta variegata TaxID=151549 RepID=A0A4C1U9J3_EUMVA|nr:hypothetical protein EVAR_15663_1 [Eumeta japonica]
MEDFMHRYRVPIDAYLSLFKSAGHSFVSFYHDPHTTDVIFGRRRRMMSLAQTISQISATTFKLVESVVNSDKGWSFIMKDRLNIIEGQMSMRATRAVMGQLRPAKVFNLADEGPWT